MPHASTGTQHACPGARGPVTLRNGNIIPAGNCNWTITDGKFRWCRKHEHLCKPHDWTYSKKDECQHCIKAKRAKKEEEDARKRKRDDDDDGKKTPKKASSANEEKKTPGKKMVTPSTHKTRSVTKKEGELEQNRALAFLDVGEETHRSSNFYACHDNLSRFRHS